MLNSPLAEGLFGAVIGAVVGSLITGFFILWQTHRLLKEERRRSEEERRAAILRVVEPISGEVTLERYESVRDAQGRIVAYNAWVLR